MKVIACGDREWRDRKLIFSTLSHLWQAHQAHVFEEHEGEEFVLIEGQCRGADKIAGEWAEMMKPRGVVHHPHPAKWRRKTPEGKEYYFAGAGPERNTEMLVEEEPDLVVAFHDAITESKGTKDMITQAEAAHVEVWLVHHEGSLV